MPYNAFKIKVTVPSMIPISMDLHVKCNFYKKKKKKKKKRKEKKRKKKKKIFLPQNFHMVFEEKIAISYQILKPWEQYFVEMSSIYKGVCLLD